MPRSSGGDRYAPIGHRAQAPREAKACFFPQAEVLGGGPCSCRAPHHGTVSHLTGEREFRSGYVTSPVIVTASLRSPTVKVKSPGSSR